MWSAAGNIGIERVDPVYFDSETPRLDLLVIRDFRKPIVVCHIVCLEMMNLFFANLR